MKMIFMGTPDFAVPILKALVQAGHEVVLAVTQPDKPKGRGKAVQFSAVKTAAMEQGIALYQPKRIKEPECVAHLGTYDAELFVVAAFGQILSKEILEMPKYGCINVHASLLPKYRGASPIQWAVINGEQVTGVTIQQMDIGVDTGEILEKLEVPLAPDETGGSLFEKLAQAGAKLCVQTVERIQDGTVTRTKQDDARSTRVGMIKKEMGNIDWTLPAERIERLVRGLDPWPSAYTFLDGKTFKIWKAKVLAGGDSTQAGKVIKADKQHLVIQTGDGQLSLLEVQLEGKKRMQADAFLRGYPLEAGKSLLQQ
ncbi:MAG: methionyl-tRNA formyltransferase [Eubacterium sp.]|nr:methionyl-tRNA formyltransferase [Eubacterium sp.]